MRGKETPVATSLAVTGLSSLEERKLESLEKTIEAGLGTFVEVGNALLEIRDARLYRASYGTFEAYCRERWGFSKSYGNMLVAAAEMATIVAIQNEGQARALAPLRDEPTKAIEVWREVTASGEPTAAKIREAVSRRLDVHFSSETDDWGTPQDLFDVLDAEFHFTLDVCASAKNAKCKRYFSRRDNGLEQNWRGTCWMNPPYGDEIPAWIEKAQKSAEAGATVVCLVPARVDTAWWWDFCRYGEIRFLRGRLKFGGSPNAAPFPSAVVVFPRKPKVVWWEWQTA